MYLLVFGYHRFLSLLVPCWRYMIVIKHFLCLTRQNYIRLVRQPNKLYKRYISIIKKPQLPFYIFDDFGFYDANSANFHAKTDLKKLHVLPKTCCLIS